MPQLNHTIVHSKNKRESAAFLTELLGLPTPKPFGPFLVVDVDNQLSLDFIEVPSGQHIDPQHYAFLVTEREFDAIFERIRGRALPFWADPRKAQPNEINRNDGGRGLYWEDPSGHYLEILTRPYGSGPV
jgi:catechol 2,3-dioxygenase-like lactoylglutathione lyase family enzyme